MSQSEILTASFPQSVVGGRETMWAEQNPEHGASGGPFYEGVSSVLGVLPPEKERNT